MSKQLVISSSLDAYENVSFYYTISTEKCIKP